MKTLIKLGGSALNHESNLLILVELIKKLKERGDQIFLVHGGGPNINAELVLRGIQWTFIDGQRVTTAEMVGVIESTLCGSVNRKLVRFLNAHGILAFGCAGTDNQTLLCDQKINLGHVGEIKKVNSDWLLSMTSLPVIAPIGTSQNGQALNINADWAASYLASALEVDELIFLTDQFGILDEEGQSIKAVDVEGLEQMIKYRVVSGGMLTKTLAIIHALNSGVKKVKVVHASDIFEDHSTTCNFEGFHHVAV